MARVKKGMGANNKDKQIEALSKSAGDVAGSRKAAEKARAKSNIYSILRAVNDGVLDANEVIFTIAKETGASLESIDGKDHVELSIALNPEQAKAVTEKLEITRTRILARDIEFIFNLEIIPAGKVEERTVVSDLNPRDQTWLTEVDVSDIALTMSKEQTEVAYGIKRPDGVIEVFDGSRRRLNAIKEGLSLKVYVTSEPLDVDDFVVFDQATEAKVPRSQRDNGIYWAKLIESGKYDIDSIAKMYGFTTKYVDNCLKYASIGDIFIGVAYAPSRLGAVNLKKLKELESICTQEQIDMLQEMKSSIINSDEFKSKDVDLAKKNAIVIDSILREVKAAQGEQESSSPAFIEVAKGKLKSQKISKKSNLKSADKGVITYEIRNYPEKVRARLEAKIDAIIAKHGSFE